MFFRRKTTGDKTAGYEMIGADMHSHLLPGIDDGSPNIETSLQLIRGMKALGYKKLITTPHIMWDMHKNTRQIILEKLEQVKLKLQEEKIDIELQAAGEYFIDDYMGQLLAQKEPLLTFGNNMVLTEFSMASQPFDLKDVLFEMQIQGYQPVIAHPERYTYLEHNKVFYDDLKDIGCLFQLNLLALTGYYGAAVLELARYLAKKGYYELVGTDLHHARHLDALNNPAITASLHKLIQAEKIQNPGL